MVKRDLCTFFYIYIYIYIYTLIITYTYKIGLNKQSRFK